MKTIHQAALVAASAVLLVACASSGGVASTRPAAQPQQASDQMVQDAAYVAMVERVARRRGVTVRWFHPPVKRIAGADADPDNQ